MAHFIQVCQQNTESINYLQKWCSRIWNSINAWRFLSPVKLLVCEGTSAWCGCWTQQKSTARNLLSTSKILPSAFHLIGNRHRRSLLECFSLSSVRVQEELITAKSGSIAVKHCSEEKRKSSKAKKKQQEVTQIFCCSSLCCFHYTCRVWDDSIPFLSPPWWVKTTSGANRQGDKMHSYSNTNTRPTMKMELKERKGQHKRWDVQSEIS